MRRGLAVGAVGGAMAIAVGLAWFLFARSPGRSSPNTTASVTAPSSPERVEAGKRIKARLFYVGESGTELTSVEQDVPYGETTVDQAKAIMLAQLAPVADPLVSAVPPGTTLRALFVTPKGEAYVDLSKELVSAHPGGSTNELLTVRTVVQALTANLPGITGVQILVDGKEVETLAGHVDLRNVLR
jgi:spore germination protein GerM